MIKTIYRITVRTRKLAESSIYIGETMLLLNNSFLNQQCKSIPKNKLE